MYKTCILYILNVQVIEWTSDVAFTTTEEHKY